MARELQSVTGAVSQSDAQRWEFTATFRNAMQQLVAPLHSVSPLQQLSSQFFSHVLYKRMREFIILLWNYLGTRPFSKILKVAENDCTVYNRAQQRFARQFAEKIAQCNSTLKRFNWKHYYFYYLYGK